MASSDTPIKAFRKDPDSILDFAIDWSDWLASGETIATSVWTLPTGITKDSESESTTKATIWLSGGTDGVNYDLVNTITTSASRTDDRTIRIEVREK